MRYTTTSDNRACKSINKAASVRKYFAVIAVAAMGLLIHTSSYAEVLSQGGWVDKKYSIKGGWEIVTENNQTIVRLNSAFSTKSGPDLKLFLSKQSIGQVTGKTATKDAVLLSALTSNSGAQEYVVPAGVNIGDFKSLLIHCEAFSVLWGGGEL